MTIEQVAEICHETNRAYCTTLGDLTQMPWAISQAWQKASARDGVRFKLAHPEARPREQHENWLKEKRAAGWKYGPVKCPEKKEHPCCVSYDALPPEQQLKDALFSAVVEACRPYVRRIEDEG